MDESKKARCLKCGEELTAKEFFNNYGSICTICIRNMEDWAKAKEERES